jgi:uncharacterized protein (TIGR02271 family)
MHYSTRHAITAMKDQTGNSLPPGDTGTSPQSLNVGAEQVVPVIQEQLEVGKVKVDTGAVRVRKVVHEDVQTFDVPLQQEEVSVTRVPVNQVVEGKFQPRQEGDTLVIPVFREVVTTHLLLVEEVRITTRRIVDSSSQQVAVRREEAVVERYDAESGSWKAEGSR